MTSLRKTVTLGYYALATLLVGVSLLAILELRLIGDKVMAGEHVTEFFGFALEIRRFEKNAFLYHQAADITEALEYTRRARRTLELNLPAFEAFTGAARLQSLETALRDYIDQMQRYAGLAEGATAERSQLERAIRLTGREIVATAEALAQEERRSLRASLDRHRLLLLGSLALLVLLAVAIGQFLSRRVTRPLMRLEAGIEAVAEGRLARLDMASPHREIVSLTRAFNHVMAELELRQRQLVRAEKLASLGTLLSGVAHELNNPLSNISSSCQILTEEGDELEPDYRRELLGQIDEQTLRARHIVRTLLDYARDVPFRRQALPLAALIEETLRLVRGQVSSRVDIRLDLPAGLQLHGDKQRLQQAFINLVRNALEVMENSGTLHIRARRVQDHAWPTGDSPHFLAFGRCQGQGEAVEIELRDDGPGIPADILPRIFDPFFTTREVGQGSGLGLFIVFEIIEEHGGCIAVESAPGQGTAFFIRLPAGKGEA